MNFVRKKKRGVNKQVCRHWYSEEQYRIIWRKEVWGVQVAPAFQAAVRELIPNYGGVPGETFECWGNVGRRRLYKTLAATQDECKRHFADWTKVAEATSGRGIVEILGKLPISVPLWVLKQLNSKVRAILFAPHVRQKRNHLCIIDEAPDDPSKTSDSSCPGSDVAPPISTPVSTVPVTESSTTPTTRRARSKGTDTDAKSAAPSAKGRGKGRKKSAEPPTAPDSKPTKRKRKSTKPSKPSDEKPLKGSRRKKSKPSAN